MGNIMISEDVVSGMTPAHNYSDTTEFQCILNDISRDLIPTGTGQIFPVVWKTDFENLNGEYIGRRRSPFDIV